MKNGMLKTGLALSLSLGMAFNASFACVLGKSGFMPENKLKITRFAKDTNGMTEQTFLSIISRVEKVYSPIVTTKGGQLKMINDWNDGTVNAFADRQGSVWQVHMFGGLARHQLTTNDGFMLVVCHELGHHMGGAPKYTDVGNDWASDEGEADYWGALKCMRRVLESDDNAKIVSKMKIDQAATKKCQMLYHTENEVALCQRIAMAGKSLGSLLGSLGGEAQVDFQTPDKSIVKKTFHNHPHAQCRLDTYFSGTLCDVSLDLDVDNKDPKVGVCLKRDGHVDGPRPLCWYKPGFGE